MYEVCVWGNGPSIYSNDLSEPALQPNARYPNMQVASISVVICHDTWIHSLPVPALSNIRTIVLLAGFVKAAAPTPISLRVHLQ